MFLIMCDLSGVRLHSVVDESEGGGVLNAPLRE